MRCPQCDREIAEAFFSDRSQSCQFKGGRFACPHCAAELVRRQIGRLPSGEALYSVRLWGHLASTRRKAAATVGEADRRERPRAKPWR
jgi:hypothetical protein